MNILPYYMIDFSAAGCLFEIRINDYPVITQNVKGQVSTYIPINYAVLESGEQTITATLLPVLGETQLSPKAYLTFKIMLFDVTNDFVFKNQLAEFNLEPKSDQVLPLLKQNDIFEAEVPYCLDAWQDGINLNDVKDVKQKLIEAYVALGSNIEKGQYNLFMDKINKREVNMATSMYLSKDETKSRVSELISDFENGFELMPLEEAIINFYANGKAVALKKSNGESALYLFNKKTKQELMLDITFYIPEGKSEFEVI
ncbi:hypothetical protein GCM10022393_19320 [Aquimarina addita]|uniref:Uncharacterized protein n=1 Tax=Aquimarina addita TaxID=870485 RepID=A0ABP6UHZ0_9FLAO